MGKQNTIQKKLRASESELPQEYSWENMQEGIFAKMENVTLPKVIPLKKKKGRRLFPIILVFGIFLMSIGTFVLLNKSSLENDKLASHIKQNRDDIQVENKEVTQYSNKDTVSANLSHAITSGEESNTSRTKTKNLTTLKESSSHQSKLLVNVNTPLNTDVLKNIDDTNANQTDDINAVSNISLLTQSSQQHSVAIQSLSNQKTVTKSIRNEKLDNIGLVALIQYKLESTFRLSDETLNNNLINLNNKSTEIHDKKRSLKLVASFGGNLYRHNYSGNDLARARNAKLSPIIGQSAILSIEYSLNQRWAIETGLSIDRSLTRLDYNGAIDTIINVDLTTHNLNNVSGITTTSVSQKDVNGTYITDVTLYNKYLSIGLPVSVNRYFSLGKLDLGIGAGLEYNYRFIKSGRYLVEPSGISPDYQLRSHSKDDSFNSHLLNGLVSLNLDYQLNNGVGIGLGIDGTYGITDAVSDQAISSHPVRTRGNLRLFKVF